MIKFFNENDRDFSKNGEFVAIPLKAVETKKKSLNGWYVDIELPISYADQIRQDMICLVPTKSKLQPQAFRIKNITKTDRTLKFQAKHVFYDAEGYYLLDVRPTNHDGQNTLSYINDRTDRKSPFIVYSNVEKLNTAYFIRKNLLEAWQIIEERWGGAFDIDNWNISLLNSIGIDRGETLYYKKNIQGIRIFEDWSNVTTRVYGVGRDGIMIDSKYLDSDIQYQIPYTKTEEFTSDLEYEEQTEENLKAELKQKMLDYLEENKYPFVSYEITSDINQNLEIGDPITIKHPLVTLKTEVQEYEYNLLTKKVTKLVFGNYTRDVKSKFDAIKNTIRDSMNRISENEDLINHQTDLINSLNKNGHAYIDDNEVFFLDQLPKEEAKYVMRLGLGGIGFSKNGIEGPFFNAWTIDGQLNADYITTGKMQTSRIEGLDEILLSVSEKTDNLDKKVDGVSANFDDFKNNEYLKSIENLQKQIDGAIQFWKGTEIPTLTNYPANEWSTNDDKDNHLGDIYYHYSEDEEGNTIALNGYRFDFVDGKYQWILLSDTELAAVQALADEANKRSQQNANSITKLQEKDAEFEVGLDNITGRVTSTEKTVENITTPIGEVSNGNHLDIPDAMESNAIEYHVDGKSEQETRSGKNLLNPSKMLKSTTLNGITYTNNDDGTFNVHGTASKDTNFELYNFTKEDLPLASYTLYSNYEYNRQTFNLNVNFIYDNAQHFLTGKNIFNLKNEISSAVLSFYVPNGVTVDYDNVKVMLSKNTKYDDTYEPYGVMPSPEFPSEIKSIPTTENLFLYDYEDNISINNNQTFSTTFENETLTVKVLKDTIGNNVFPRFKINPELLKNGKKYLISSVNVSGVVNSLSLQLRNKDGSSAGLPVANEIVYDDNYDLYVLRNVLGSGSISLTSGTTAIIKNIQVMESTKTKSYVPYGHWAKVKIIGENLYNYKDTAEVSSGFTVDDDGGITITYDNSSGTSIAYKNYYTHDLKLLKENTKYNVFFEVKNVSGSGSIYVLSDYMNNGQFKDGMSFVFSNLKNGQIIQELKTTKKSFSNIIGNVGLRTFATFSAGQSGSITFRISVLEDTNITSDNFSYKPYQEKEVLIDLNKYDEEGRITGFYELSSLPDGTKDTLDIIDGQVVLNKNVRKANLNDIPSNNFYTNNTSISGKLRWATQYFQDMKYRASTTNKFLYSRYLKSSTASKTYQCEEGISAGGKTIHIYIENMYDYTALNNFLQKEDNFIYYPLETPEQIILPTVNIPLYEGINHVELVDDLETNTSIKYLKNTPLSEAYATRHELKQTETSLQTEIEQKVTDSEASIRSEVSGTYTTKEETNTRFDEFSIDNTNMILNSNVPVLTSRQGIVAEYDITESLVEGDYYTINFYDVYTTAAVIEVWDTDFGSQEAMNISQNGGNYSFTFRATDLRNTKKHILIYASALVGTFEYSSIKLTHSSKPTFWTGSSQDYSTTTEMDAKIDQKVSESEASITSSVSAKFSTKDYTEQLNRNTVEDSRNYTANALKDYTKTTEMTNIIEQKVTESENTLNLEIAKKVNNSDYTYAKIVEKINNDTSSILIDADRLNLKANDIINLIAGNTINLTSKNIVVDSTNLKITKEGDLTCKNANITGTINATTGKVGNFDITGDSLIIEYNDSHGSTTFAEMSKYGFGVWHGTRTVKTEVLTLMYDDTSNSIRAYFGNNTNSYLTAGNGSFAGSLGVSEVGSFSGQLQAHQGLYVEGSQSNFHSNTRFYELVQFDNGINIGTNASTITNVRLVTGSSNYVEISTPSSVWGVSMWLSDKRLKKNIEDSTYNALEKILAIKHREFDYKTGGHVKNGYIADELEEIDIDFIFEIGEEKMKQPAIDKIIPAITKAIQEQQEIIDQQQKKIDDLEERIKKLESLVLEKNEAKDENIE